jgi:hypothetical protein
VTERMAYVARCECGHIVAAAMDEPAYRKDNAKEVARWMRDGLTIERMDVEAVRVYLHECTCPKKAKPSRQTALDLEVTP